MINKIRIFILFLVCLILYLLSLKAENNTSLLVPADSMRLLGVREETIRYLIFKSDKIAHLFGGLLGMWFVGEVRNVSANKAQAVWHSKFMDLACFCFLLILLELFQAVWRYVSRNGDSEFFMLFSTSDIVFGAIGASLLVLALIIRACLKAWRTEN